MPPPSSAATSFINESTLPRITPSLASMRWMVGSDRPDNSASLRWSTPSSARAARSCAAVIMLKNINYHALNVYIDLYNGENTISTSSK